MKLISHSMTTQHRQEHSCLDSQNHCTNNQHLIDNAQLCAAKYTTRYLTRYFQNTDNFLSRIRIVLLAGIAIILPVSTAYLCTFSEQSVYDKNSSIKAPVSPSLVNRIAIRRTADTSSFFGYRLLDSTTQSPPQISSATIQSSAKTSAITFNNFDPCLSPESASGTEFEHFKPYTGNIPDGKKIEYSGNITKIHCEYLEYPSQSSVFFLVIDKISQDPGPFADSTFSLIPTTKTMTRDAISHNYATGHIHGHPTKYDAHFEPGRIPACSYWIYPGLRYNLRYSNVNRKVEHSPDDLCGTLEVLLYKTIPR